MALLGFAFGLLDSGWVAGFDFAAGAGFACGAAVDVAFGTADSCPPEHALSATTASAVVPHSRIRRDLSMTRR